MGRPSTKAELLTASNTKYDKLLATLNELTDVQKTKNFDWTNQKTGNEAHWQRDNNVKDILIHLYEWHQLYLIWVTNNLSGKESTFIPAPYNWRTYGEMNVEFTKKHLHTSYTEAFSMFVNSHEKVMELIESLSNEALFTKNYYKWVGGSTLGSYAVSATSSHYEWAIKKINRHKEC